MSPIIGITCKEEKKADADKEVSEAAERKPRVPINSYGRRTITDLIAWHRETYTDTDKGFCPLFPSRNGRDLQRMLRRTAHNVLKTV